MKEDASKLLASPEVGAQVVEYATRHSTALPKHIADYHARISEEREDSFYMSSNFQSQYHIFLAKTIGAKRVLEIGVYVGYSALVWSHAVGPDGSVTGLEYSPEYAQLARDAFAANGVQNAEVVVGPAAETLLKLNPAEPYDVVFLDADKTGNPGYLEALLTGSQPGSKSRLLRPGALIVADNVLRHGKILDKANKEDGVEATRRYNTLAVANPRLETFFVPLWDGLNVSRLLD